MIVDDVCKSAGIGAAGGFQQLLRFFGNRMEIGELIDLTVKHNALLDRRRVIEFLFALDEITDHIAGEDRRVFKREICVGEVIHVDCMMRVLSRERFKRM